MHGGCGLVTFHFSTFAPEKYRDKILDWNGGYFQWETDGKKQWYSAITTADADFDITVIHRVPMQQRGHAAAPESA